MTVINSATLQQMRARREAGATVKDIATQFGVKATTIYQQFNRKLGGTPVPGPANDNHPYLVTRKTPHNGGCSTTSGKMPVTLPRIPSIDGHAPEVAA